jgi:hypothetical protein
MCNPAIGLAALISRLPSLLICHPSSSLLFHSSFGSSDFDRRSVGIRDSPEFLPLLRSRKVPEVGPNASPDPTERDCEPRQTLFISQIFLLRAFEAARRGHRRSRR